MLDGFLGRGLLKRQTLPCYKTAPPSTRFLLLHRTPHIMMFIVVLSIFIIQVWSQTITVNTTSGRLLGIQADRGMVFPLHFVALLTPYNPPTSGILQGHCKIPTIAHLE